MKAHLQYQAERLRQQIEELQQTLRRSRRALTAILQDIEELEDVPKSASARVDNAEVIG